MPTMKVMADYQSFPLWEDGDNVDPVALPLSPQLSAELLAWADRYDATLNDDDPLASGFDSPAAEATFYADGLALARRVAAELGSGHHVEFFDGTTTKAVS